MSAVFSSIKITTFLTYDLRLLTCVLSPTQNHKNMLDLTVMEIIQIFMLDRCQVIKEF